MTRALIQILRPHQWSKNLLLLLPVITAHKWSEPTVYSSLIVGILAFCLASSSIYVLNDWRDRREDSQHPSKRQRPFASGRLEAGHAAWLIPLLAGLSLLLGWQVNREFFAALLAYELLAWAYCLAARGWLWADAIVLSGLYTLRVVAGAAAISVTASPWLLGFSVFLFYSLAALKRMQEFQHADWISRSRPYRQDDRPVVLAVGISAGIASVVVLALYLNSEEMLALYRRPAWLWLLCPLLLYWISRAWTMAFRGELDTDPILFALRDRVSWGVLALSIAVVYVAT